MKLPYGRRYSALVQPHPRIRQAMSSTDAVSFHYRNSYTPSSQSFLNDPECISLRERLLKGDDPNCLVLENESESPTVTIDLLQRLIIHLREFEERCAASANYKDAKKIHDIQITVKDKIKAYMQSQISNSNFIFQNDTDRMENLRKKHEDELNKFDDETNEKIKYIEKLHQQALERFEQSWSEKPRQYQKPSQHLIELKKTEQNLAKIGQYDLATQINAEASNLAKEEAVEKQKKIVADYKKAKKRLIEKQNREFQSIIANRAEQRLIIESKQQLEMDSANNRTIVNQQRNKLYNSSKALGSTNTSNSRSTSNVGTNSNSILSFTNIPAPKKSFAIPSYIGTRSSMRSRIYSLPPSAKANIWARNSINGSRSSSVSNSEQQNPNAIYDQQPSLLPPLIPPTDPSIIENEQKEKRKKTKLFQQAAIRREKEKRRRMELVQEEIAREKQIKEQRRQKLRSKNNNKQKVVNNSIIENDIKQIISDTNQTPEQTSTDDTSNNDKPIPNLIETPGDDSEYYYYEEEEEIIEEEEESKENDNPFVPISSCGSSSFHQLSSIIDENPFAETSEVISKINSSKSINNNSKVDFKINNSDHEDTDTDDLTKIKVELQKSKSDTLESKMYDPSDPLFHSVPNLKAMKDKKDNDIAGASKYCRRFSSTDSNNNLLLEQSTGLTSTSISDFELDSIPLDVTSFINGSFTDPFDSTFDENYLNSIEGRPTSLSENTSTHDIKELTKQIAS